MAKIGSDEETGVKTRKIEPETSDFKLGFLKKLDLETSENLTVIQRCGGAENYARIRQKVMDLAKILKIPIQDQATPNFEQISPIQAKKSSKILKFEDIAQKLDFGDSDFVNSDPSCVSEDMFESVKAPMRHMEVKSANIRYRGRGHARYSGKKTILDI